MSLAAAAGLGATVLIAGAATSTAPRTGTLAPEVACASPHLPLYGATYTGGGVANRQLWPTYAVDPPAVDGTDLDHARPRYLAGPDTDGDGRGDDVTIDLSSGEQVMVISRSDGEVRVGLRGSNLGDLTSRPLGDLDDDGRDEVLFLARPSDGGDDRIFVLPGSTPVGSHQADDVSIQVPSYFLYGTGDQVDDAGDDLVVTDTDPPPGAGLVSGRDVMAPGPGAILDSFPIAVPLPGYPAGVFDLGDARPAVATADDRGGRFVVRLWRDGETTAFETAGADLGSAYFSVSMSRTDERTYLRAGRADRGGGVSFTWDVDDPCRVLPPHAPGEAPGTGVPAAPVPGQASYTG